MSCLTNDFKYALRTLARTPALTLAALFALAVGIGATASIFSLVDRALFRPLPYRDADRIVTAWNTWQEKGFAQLPVVPSDYVEWRKQATAFDALAASCALDMNLTGAGDAERLHGSRASHSLFPLLGVRPALGRAFSAADDRVGAPRVAILSDGLWRRRFGGAREAIGRAITLDGNSYTVVGVMPPRFNFSIDFKMTGLVTPAVDLWVPLALRPEELNDSFNLTVVGRLKPGVPIARADADLKTIGARISAQVQDHKGIGVTVIGLRDLLTRDIRPAVVALGVAVGLVLLVACANVANLLLTKASGRRHEIGVRLALGASRWQLLRQLLIESLVLGALAAIFGLALATGATAVLARYAPAAMLRAGAVGVDLRVIGFTAAASLLSSLLFGVIPALQSLNTNLDGALRQSARGGVGDRRQGRIRSVLVVAEIALAVLLVVGSALLLQSFSRIIAVDPGFDARGLTTARVSLPASRYPSGIRMMPFYDEMLSRLRACPEVAAASLVSYLPLEQAREVFFRIEGRPNDNDPKRSPVATSLSVDPTYFSVMRIPLERGRFLTDADRVDTEPVTVIDETLARRYWPGQDPIGRRIREGYSGTTQQWMRVVGVVGSVRQYGLAAAVKPGMYVSYRQFARREMMLVARGRSTPTAVASAIRRVVRQIDAAQPVDAIRTMEDVIAGSVAERGFSASLLTAFAGVALLLAAVGVYAVMSYAVSRRTREIGLRKALGAQTGEVVGYFLRRGLALTTVGLALGVAAALCLTRWLSSQLYDVKPTDPLTFVAACVLLLAVAMLACWVPARRASLVDPNVVLRQE